MPLQNQSAKKRRVIRSAAKSLLPINGASVFAAQFKIENVARQQRTSDGKTNKRVYFKNQFLY